MVPVLASYLGSEEFQLVPLFDGSDADGIIFLVLAFPGIERTLPPDILYGIANDLRSDLGLISCEPDIGANVFVDPEETPPPGVESAIVDAQCWATGSAPPNRLWALANIGPSRLGNCRRPRAAESALRNRIPGSPIIRRFATRRSICHYP